MSALQSRFCCTGLKRSLPSKRVNFRCTWIEPEQQQPYGQMLIGRWQLSDWSMESVRWHLLNSSFSINYSHIMSNNYCRKSRGKRSQKQIHQKTWSTENCCRRRGLWGGKLDHRQACATSDLSIRFWDWSHHLEHRVFRSCSESAGERDLWYHFEKPHLVYEGILHPHGQVWSLVAAIGVPELHKTIEQCVIHFGYPKMHYMTQISESIWPMGSVNIFTTDISDQLHVCNVKQAHQSNNKVNYIQQMLKHNDCCTGLDSME